MGSRKEFYSGKHAGTMVDPEVSLERRCMLGRFPVVLWACPPLKDIYQSRREHLAHIPRLNSVKRVRQNRCLLSSLAWQYPCHTGVDDTTTILVNLVSYQDAGKVGVRRMGCPSLEKENRKEIEACLLDRVEPRHQSDTHRWEIGSSGHRN